MPGGANSNGIEVTISTLAAEGRLTDEDEALVALARGLAAAVDADPGNAALWREYRAAVTALTVAGSERPDDDARDFLLRIRTPGRAEVGDSTLS